MERGGPSALFAEELAGDQVRAVAVETAGISAKQHTRFDVAVLVLLFGIALSLRLAAVAVTPGLNTPPGAGTDEQEYDTYAWNLAQGRGYRGMSIDVTDRDHPTAYRTPTAPLYFAAVYAVFGHSYLAIHVCDAVLAGLTVWLIAAIAHRCFDRRVALLAAAVYTFYPIAIYYALDLLSEVISAFLVCLFVWCWLNVPEKRGWSWTIAAGGTFGVLLLSKAGFLFAIPFLVVAGAWMCGRRIELWKRMLVMPAVTAVPLAIWAARNVIVMGALIPFSTGGGQLLLATSNRFVVGDPQLYGYSVPDNSLPEYAPALRAPDDEIQRDALAKQFAMTWLKANPEMWPYLVQARFLRLWNPMYYGESYSRFQFPAALYYALILILFVIALPGVTARFVADRRPGLVMHALILGTVVMALVFHGQHRYRFPVDSLNIIIAMAGLVQLVDGVAAARREGLGGVLGRAARRYGVVAVCAALLSAGFWVYWQRNVDLLERYRDQECRDRLRDCRQAVLDYRRAHGRLPERLGALIPEFLPNIDRLHCPRHTLGWNDYGLMAATDAGQAAHALSYKLITEPGGARIVETASRHAGRANVLEIPPAEPAALPE